MAGGRILTIDIGNTHANWAVFAGAHALEVGRRPHSERWGATPSLWATAERMGIAAVHDGGIENLRSVWTEALPPWTAPLTHEDLSLETTVPDPAGVGIDRLLTVFAWARRNPGVPAVVVDFGTAITLDLVDEAGRFRGGLIVPGPDLLADSLAWGTSRLPELEVTPDLAPSGEDTTTAITRGISGLLVGGLERLIQRAVADLDPRARIIATGGGASIWAPSVEMIEEVEPLLCREGIRRAVEERSPEPQRGE